MLAPQPGIKPATPALESKVLATGPPGKYPPHTHHVKYFLIFFHWTTVALQYCASFCCKAKWISHMCTQNLSSLNFLSFQVTTGH